MAIFQKFRPTAFVFALLCVTPAGWAQMWKTAVVAVTADPRRADVEAVFEFSPAASGDLPKFAELGEGVCFEWESAASAQAALEGPRKLRVRLPVGVVSGERTVVLPYLLGESGKADALMVKLSIPAIAEATPRRLVWRQGDSEPKVSEIKCITPEGIIYNRAISKSEKFAVKFEREAPHIYRLTVTPSAPLASGRSVVVVEGQNVSGSRTSFNVYLEIQ
jgi:hypothetical protein